MKRVTNVAASVRQRLLDEAKRRGESFDYVASLYARERFLDRLTRSPHRGRLTLKGASVFALWSDAHRPTRDLDFLGNGTFDLEEAATVIREIIEVSAEDGLSFDRASVVAEPIREADEYHGVRIYLSATLDTARIRMQIDIAVGDVVTPPAREATLPTILDDFSAPRVFLRKTSVRAPEDFPLVGALLRAFLVPVMDSARSAAPTLRVWRSGVWRRQQRSSTS